MEHPVTGARKGTSKSSTMFPDILLLYLLGTSAISNFLHLLKQVNTSFKHVIFFFPKYLDPMG